jgi:hypothetical protein
VWCAQHEWCSLRGGKQDAESEECCPIDWESAIARKMLPVDKKDDRCGDAENGPTNLLKWIQDQTRCTVVCPSAKCCPGERTNVLPRWHFDKCPVHATARQAIKGSGQKDATKQKVARSRGYQVFLVSLVRMTHFVDSPYQS